MPDQSPLNCQIIAQAVLVGPQTVGVRVFSRNEGWDKPYISLRIGRLLINIEDAQAVADLTHVVCEANLNADRPFGPARTGDSATARISASWGTIVVPSRRVSAGLPNTSVLATGLRRSGPARLAGRAVGRWLGSPTVAGEQLLQRTARHAAGGEDSP